MQLKFFSFVITSILTSDIYTALRWPKSNYKMTMIQLHRQIIQEYLIYFYYWNLRLCVKIFKRIHFYHPESIALNIQFHVKIIEAIYFWYKKFITFKKKRFIFLFVYCISCETYAFNKNKKLETHINE